MERIVIVGGVAAGATAAAKVRRMSPTAHITLFEAGPDISFANCGLPYYIGGDIKSRSKLILQSPESFDEQYQVDVFINTRITELDRNEKRVKSMNVRTGEISWHEYDKLILAQGGRPIKPSIDGVNQSHVFTLWTLGDMDYIKMHIDEKEPKEAVVVGGGFIGLEMVEALAHRDIKVHLVEMQPHVMAVMDGEIAGFIEKEMIEHGVEIHTGKAVTGIGSNTVKLNDGTELNAEMVIMSIGVRPTLQLAIDAGLEIGESGGLLVDEYLQTSDEDIYSAGDMVEVTHRISGKRVRIPLAGPANRQGRIAAVNALGGKHAYRGAMGTSILRVFKAVAGVTGLSLCQARAQGIPADSITVHKEHHVTYYPGSKDVTVKLVYNRETGEILGGQTAGYAGAARRLDIIAAAIAGKMSIHELADVDFAYSPPLGTANDAINMAAFVAENRKSGYGPAIAVSELDDLIKEHNPVILDVRDLFSFEKSKIEGAQNIPLEILPSRLKDLDKSKKYLVYDEHGKRGHQAVRMLMGVGVENVWNISGGNISVQRHQIAVGFNNIKVKQLPYEEKDPLAQPEETTEKAPATEQQVPTDSSSPLVVDIRTPMEFMSGAYPGAINICLDEIPDRIDMFGDKDRDITFYCVSGARSAYAQQILREFGYTNVKNGGGLMHMMMRLKKD